MSNTSLEKTYSKPFLLQAGFGFLEFKRCPFLLGNFFSFEIGQIGHKKTREFYVYLETLKHALVTEDALRKVKTKN
jgi:hypothetical protein